MAVRRMMQREKRSAMKKAVGGLVLTCMVPFSALGQGTSTSDAQVEANVLKALADAPALSTENIQSATVYGVVTLSGSVATESLRSQAENLVARAPGVKKVVDELTLGAAPAGATAGVDGGNPAGPAPGDASQPVLRSDGTYGPPVADPSSAGSATPSYQDPGAAAAGQPVNDGNGQPYANRQPGYNQQGNGQPGYGQPAYGQQSAPVGNGYPVPQQSYPQQGYSRQPAGVPPQGYPGPNTYAPQGGQVAGLQVAVPAGALLRVRVNRGLDSNHTKPGTAFDGTVLTDVIAGGAVAIPRGATVNGVVVDTRHAGALKGEGELALSINSVVLGGQVYPLQSDLWQREGRDKSVRTVNSALGLGVLGAIVGGVAGGGAGAAIGAGVGAGAGVAGSAASPGGQIVVPAEAVLSFHLTAPAEVRTVSEGEMQRLAYAAGPGAQPGYRPVVRRRYYPGYGYPYAAQPYPYPGY